MLSSIRFLIMSWLLLPGFLEASPAWSQDAIPPAKDLFERASGAMGPAERLDSLKAISCRGTVKMQTGAKPFEGAYTLICSQQSRGKSIVTIQGTEFRAFSNEQYAWSETLGRVSRLDGGWVTFSQLMHAMILPREHAKHFDQVKTVGEAKFDGLDVFEVECWKDAKLVATFYFAKESGHLTGFTMELDEFDTTVVFRDFKQVDGVTLAHQVEVRHLADTQRIAYTSIVFNEQLDDSEFIPPASVKSP